MHELLPTASGAVLAVLLKLLRPSLRVPAGTALVAALGTIATVASGEYELSWAFLAVDIPIVALSAAIGLTVLRRLTPRSRSVQKSVRLDKR